MTDTQEVIKDFGDYELIFGNEQNNTLTGSEAANAFVHRNGTNDLIKSFNPSEDVIILTDGKVSESMNSSDGNDVILKIADGNNSLGTITVKNVARNFITIQDKEQLNERKKVLSEFTNAYVKAAIRTFEEDEDIKSILTDGENSTVLAKIKAVNPEIAAQIATALKLSYESGIAYLERNSSETASHNVIETNSNFAQPLKNSGRSVVYYASSNVDTDNLDHYNNLFSQCDYYSTVLGEVSKLAKVGSSSLNVLSKCAGALSVATAAGTCVLYDAMLYSENVQDWQNAGSQGNNPWQKLALIRDQNSEIFDGAAKSHVNLAFAVGGFVTLGIMGVAGVAAAPVIITASVFAAAPIVVGWAYDKFIANKLGEEADSFHEADSFQEAMKNNFNDSISEISEDSEDGEIGGVDDVADRWMSAIGQGSDYGKTNYKKYVAPHYYCMEVYDNGGRYISNSSVNYVFRKYKDSSGEYWDHPKNKVYYKIDGKNDWYWEYVYDSNGNHPTVSGDGVFLTGGAGDDTISNGGSKVTISGGAGNDTISNYGENVIINGGAGNDTIYNGGSKVTINGGAGSDTIYNYGAEVTINGGAGDDLISISGSYGYALNNLINAGEGNNTVTISGNNSIEAGEGNNTVLSYNDNNTIKTGAGDDYYVYIYGYGKNSIDFGDGNNTIENGSGTIKTGAGDDYISFYAEESSIDAGDGNNTIVGYYHSTEYSSNTTIKTGAGDDYLSLACSTISVDAGEGNNYIHIGFSATDVTVKAGSGDDYIYSFYSENVSIEAGEGNNTVISEHYTNTIKTGSGDDLISLSGSGLVDAGEGNNIIIGDGTIKTGSGDDLISISSDYAYDVYSSIDAGTGNNTVYGSGTIKTGKGDDLISISGSYADDNSIEAGEGNNTVLSYNDNNRLRRL